MLQPGNSFDNSAKKKKAKIMLLIKWQQGQREGAEPSVE